MSLWFLIEFFISGQIFYFIESDIRFRQPR